MAGVTPSARARPISPFSIGSTATANGRTSFSASSSDSLSPPPSAGTPSNAGVSHSISSDAASCGITASASTTAPKRGIVSPHLLRT